jgi:cobalt/nickel transport system permease protein
MITSGLPYPLFPVLAVHISDGVLTQSWLLGGWLAAAVLALIGSWNIRDEEIPRIALLTAAFFVASSIHPPIPGPSRVHLLLNGLVGVVLHRRAALAIPIGLFMQAAILGHGAYSTLGINSCVQVVPALGAGQLFAGLQRFPWLRHPWCRAVLVAVSILACLLTLVYSGAMLASQRLDATAELDASTANRLVFSPLVLGAVVGIGCLGAWLERRLDHAPEFPLGLLVGALTVLATVVLHSIVLFLGGEADWHLWALTSIILHLPIAVIEGVVLGFTVGFLVRVKPEMLGWTPKERAA